MTKFTHSHLTRVSFAPTKPGRNAQRCAHWRSPLGPYRSDLHYMRGLGPEWCRNLWSELSVATRYRAVRMYLGDPLRNAARIEKVRKSSASRSDRIDLIFLMEGRLEHRSEWRPE